MKTFLLALVCFAALGCNKTKSDKTDLIGKWNLTEYLMDPGNGSGKWTPAGTQFQASITFEAGGKFVGTGSFFNEYNRYTVSPDSTIVFSSTTNSTTVPHRYRIVNSILELNPPCFEACGFRFAPSKK